MSGQGYHFAVASDTLRQLLACQDTSSVLGIVDRLYDGWDTDLENSAGGYKQWDVLHCCLSDGTSNPSSGTYPLNRCFLGGRLLVTQGSIVNLVMPQEVKDVADAFDRLGPGWFLRE